MASATVTTASSLALIANFGAKRTLCVCDRVSALEQSGHRAHARVLIQGWELMDRVQPSNPQGHFGAALDAKLAPVFASTASAGQ